MIDLQWGHTGDARHSRQGVRRAVTALLLALFTSTFAVSALAAYAACPEPAASTPAEAAPTRPILDPCFSEEIACPATAARALPDHHPPLAPIGGLPATLISVPKCVPVWTGPTFVMASAKRRAWLQVYRN